MERSWQNVGHAKWRHPFCATFTSLFSCSGLWTACDIMDDIHANGRLIKIPVKLLSDSLCFFLVVLVGDRIETSLARVILPCTWFPQAVFPKMKKQRLPAAGWIQKIWCPWSLYQCPSMSTEGQHGMKAANKAACLLLDCALPYQHSRSVYRCSNSSTS